MIALFCMLIVLGLSHCDELPSRIEVESSINRTITEVERLIRTNSSLPRLSRREIVDILFNITSRNLETYQSKETIEEARKIYQRALMVVLPFNAENAKENITDLYTRPPIIRVIADTSLSAKDLQKWSDEEQSTTEKTRHNEESLENLVVTHASEKTTSKETSTAKTRFKNHRETYSEVNTKMKFDSAPIKFSFNLENLQKQQTTTGRSTTVRGPVFPGTSTTKDENVFIVYSTSATPRTTEASPKDIMKISTSRPFKQEAVLSANQWRYNAPTSGTQSKTTKVPDLTFKKIHNKQPFTPTAAKNVMDANSAIGKMNNVTEISKITSGKIEDSKQSTAIYVTPMTPSSSFASGKPKYNSTYNFNSGGFRRITTAPPSTTTTTRPELMDLLASIGLRPENANNVEEVFEKSKESFENSQIANSNGFVYPTSGLTSVMPDLPSITSQNTFENPVSEIGKGINNLTPDVQLLFQRFGLQTSNPTTTTTSTTPKPTAKTNSYTNFKALPTSSKIKDPDMKDFLAQFGLGDSRQKKAMSISTERPSLIEAVPNNMRQILENVGLISRKIPKTTPKLEEAKPTEATKFHVFKPHEVEVKDERQKTKINELLDTIRLVQEGKANATDVRKAANDLLETAKTLKEDGPDPLNFEEIIKMYNEDSRKNEVKRQNRDESVETTTNQDVANTTPTTATSISTASDVSSETSTTTTTVSSTTSDSAKDGSDFLNALTPVSESSATANLAALEESFGGSTSAPDPVLPTKRRSGLYFLVDWNTFLEVGEEDKEKINLRFQPKAGDKSRFLPITVP